MPRSSVTTIIQAFCPCEIPLDWARSSISDPPRLLPWWERHRASTLTLSHSHEKWHTALPPTQATQRVLGWTVLKADFDLGGTLPKAEPGGRLWVDQGRWAWNIPGTYLPPGGGRRNEAVDKHEWAGHCCGQPGLSRAGNLWGEQAEDVQGLAHQGDRELWYVSTRRPHQWFRAAPRSTNLPALPGQPCPLQPGKAFQRGYSALQAKRQDRGWGSAM